CAPSIGLAGERLNATKSIAGNGGTLLHTEIDALPPQAYTVGQSYLLFITDGDWDSGNCIGLPGLIAETNENNNYYVLPLYIPKPAKLSLNPTSVSLSGGLGSVLTQSVVVTNLGDVPLTWSATSSDARL